jgi:hypothetical protein
MINKMVGFDTEYKSEDLGRNTLVSVQLSQGMRTILKVPIHKPYTFSRRGVLDNRLSVLADYSEY